MQRTWHVVAIVNEVANVILAGKYITMITLNYFLSMVKITAILLSLSIIFKVTLGKI